MLQPGLLGLQADPAEWDGPAARRGGAVLAGLRRLQLRLLSGEAASEEALLGLRAELAGLPRPADPRLAAALAAIALRVEVELARRPPDQPATPVIA